MLLWIVVFWVVILRNIVIGYEGFGGICCLRHQDRKKWVK
jgi:uncharacterized membrane protein YtjA (UPF0391 family)